MHYYLCNYGTGGRPAGGEDISEWTSINLSPAPWAVWASPSRYCGLWRTYLGDDAHAKSPAVRRILRHALQLPLGSLTLGQLLLEILLAGSTDGKRRWRPLQPAGNRYEVWLGNELIAQMPVIAGGGWCAPLGQPTFDFFDNFNRADETPLGAPYEVAEIFGGGAFYSAEPINLVESTICHAPSANSGVAGGVIDPRGYCPDQSAQIAKAMSVALPSNSRSRRAGLAAMCRVKTSAERAAINPLDPAFNYSPYAYYSHFGDPTALTYEWRLTKAAELVSVYPSPLWINYVLAQVVYSAGSSLPSVGETCYVSAIGSSINGRTSLAMTNGPVNVTITDTESDRGHPGFYGHGENLGAKPYFDNFQTTGLLDGGDTTFIDP